ncbi:MAG: diadenylate cyclase CdaA [Pseudomonadota bacterium]
MLNVVWNIGLNDAIDILIVAVVIYEVILLIRGTRAVQMLVGLAILFGVFLISREFDLLTLHWMLGNFLGSILLVIIILFQSDIRRALMRVGRGPFFKGSPEEQLLLREVTNAATALAAKRTGALIALERRINLGDYLEMGTPIDGRVSEELMIGIFNPASPMHDGAVVIQSGRLSAAGCFLPISRNPNLSRSFGTRHRAGIGLSEETDAVVIIVSEETGKISLAVGGQITPGLDGPSLRQALHTFFHLEERAEPKVRWGWWRGTS